MKFYDDNQKKVRYRFGFYSLLFMTALLFIYISLPIDSLGGISYQNAIMIIIMASIVGGIMLSVMLPIMTLYQNIG